MDAAEERNIYFFHIKMDYLNFLYALHIKTRYGHYLEEFKKISKNKCCYIIDYVDAAGSGGILETSSDFYLINNEKLKKILSIKTEEQLFLNYNDPGTQLLKQVRIDRSYFFKGELSNKIRNIKVIEKKYNINYKYDKNDNLLTSKTNKIRKKETIYRWNANKEKYEK